MKGSSTYAGPTGFRATATSGGSRALTSSANLLQLLPTGSVLAFQALAATFTNQGNCYPSNWWLTVGLLTFLSATCIFFAFTDTVVYKGKVHHGVALPGRLLVFNLSEEEHEELFRLHALEKRGLKPVDYLHAFFTEVVFLAVAGSDVGLQDCFFPHASEDTQQLLKNLPLGMAVVSSFVFMVFPTTRKGISFDDSDYAVVHDVESSSRTHHASASSDTTTTHTASNAAAGTEAATDRVLTSSANLLQLLPTGSVLAFQTLAATFTNQGHCYPANWWLTVGLVAFLGATCVFFAFTDSVEYKGKLHHGVALPGRLLVFNLSEDVHEEIFSELHERRLKPVDWIHAFFSAVVFLAIALSDVGLQNCFFPHADDDTRQLLKNLPLGMAVVSSFVFMLFPATRKGIGFDNSDYSIITAPSESEAATSSGNKVAPHPESTDPRSQPPAPASP